tara:strand:+ start:2478 stop:2909 length:432 start_codon:yes stop_codon:yes gene_type:complete
MATTEREDALDRKLSGQSKTDRLIDGAAALIAGQAYELMLSHTVSGVWPESEAHVKAEHDMLLEVVGELRELKANCQGILDTSDHIPDATKMIQGDVQCMGNLYFNDEDNYENALVITFVDRAGLKAALDSKQCRFTVFGGEV